MGNHLIGNSYQCLHSPKDQKYSLNSIKNDDIEAKIRWIKSLLYNPNALVWCWKAGTLYVIVQAVARMMLRRWRRCRWLSSLHRRCMSILDFCFIGGASFPFSCRLVYIILGCIEIAVQLIWWARVSSRLWGLRSGIIEKILVSRIVVIMIVSFCLLLLVRFMFRYCLFEIFLAILLDLLLLLLGNLKNVLHPAVFEIRFN